MAIMYSSNLGLNIDKSSNRRTLRDQNVPLFTMQRPDETHKNQNPIFFSFFFTASIGSSDHGWSSLLMFINIIVIKYKLRMCTLEDQVPLNVNCSDAIVRRNLCDVFGAIKRRAWLKSKFVSDFLDFESFKTSMDLGRQDFTVRYAPVI
eukprot:PhF_6_TR25497/c1_g2_i4/m.35512